MKLFRFIDFETISTCNRACPTCIRNSHPNRNAVSPWFEETLLPIWVIDEALKQCQEMGFAGGVCLSHYNEPLLDRRIVELVELVKSHGYYVFFNTNGDFLTEELAKELEGLLDRIIVSLYMDEPVKSKRAEWIYSLFSKTEAQVSLTSHMVTHFSPDPRLGEMIERHKGRACQAEPSTRVIINHRREYLLCCEDVIGNFNLGTFPELGIGEYWFGQHHASIVENLNEMGGRLKYPYCSTCPRS